MTPRAARTLAWVGAWCLLLTQLAFAQGDAAMRDAAPRMDGVAAVSEGPSVALRWSLPGEVFPAGGFVLTRIAPDGSASSVTVASPLPPELAPIDADTFEAIETLFDPTLVPLDDDEALALAFLRAAFTLEAAADPDLARALGILVEHEGLVVGERWRYEVATAAGAHVGSAEITVGSTPPLDAPTGLVAEAAVGGIGLRWHTPDEATLVFGHRIEIRALDGSFVDLGSGWLTAPEPDAAAPEPFWFVDATPRFVGSEVVYRVVGRDLFGRETPPSQPVALVVPDPEVLPQALIVDAESGDRSVTLHWSLPADPRVVAVGVLRAPNPDDAPALVSPLFDVSVQRWTDAGLRGGVDYYYAIASFDDEGLVAVGPLWAQRAVNPNPPAAPHDLSVVPQEDGLVLTWRAPSDDDVGRYQVYGGRPGTAFERMTLLAETTDLTVVVPIPANTLFDVALRVRAVNTSDVAGAPSSEVAGRPLDATPPSAPLWLDSQGVERAIELRWLRDLDPDVAFVRLSRAEGAVLGADGTLVAGVFRLLADGLSPETTSFRDEDVVAGVVYAYRLEAVDASGNVSEPSEVRTASAWGFDVPGAPTGLQVETLEAGVALRWDGSEGVLGWVVERWHQAAWVEISDLLEAPSYVDIRGAAGDRYQVRAVSAAGQVGEAAEGVAPGGE